MGWTRFYQAWQRLTPCLTAALFLFATTPAAGQPTATLKGRIVDDETGQPVLFATIRIAGRAPLMSDSMGRFQLLNLDEGKLDIAIQAIGFLPRSFLVTLVAGQSLDRTFGLSFSGVKLGDLEVKARADRLAPRYSEFERRRGLGMGTYFRWDQIKDRGFHTVGDALRTARGVRITCDQARFECYAAMSRTPGCHPTWWIDGVQVRSFHENTPIRDVYGIEIYRGPGEIPADFGGSTGGCGVIVMWTKSRPYR